MWLIFDKIEYKTDLESRKGSTYSGYVVTGTKRGFDSDPDEPYSKVFFEGNFVDVLQGGETFKMDLIEFFKQCQSGDLLVTKSEKAGTEKWNWKISQIENRARKVVDGGQSMKPNYNLPTVEAQMKAAAATTIAAYTGKLGNVEKMDKQTLYDTIAAAYDEYLAMASDLSELLDEEE